MDWDTFFPGITLVLLGLFGVLFPHTGLAVESLLEGLEGIAAFMLMLGLIFVTVSILKDGLRTQLDKLLIGIILALLLAGILTYLIIFA